MLSITAGIDKLLIEYLYTLTSVSLKAFPLGDHFFMYKFTP